MRTFALLGLSLNPLSYLSSFINDLFTAALNLLGAAASNVVTALLGFITTTSDPVFSGGWWSSSGEAVFVRVLAVSGSMMALVFMLSVVTAMISSNHTILTKALLRLPLAAIEMALLTTVTAALLSATDEVSIYIAGGTSHGLAEFVGVGLVAAVTDTGVVGLVIGGLIILAGLAVWAQFLIRTALLYCAVMAGPLVFAAAVHPSASGVRKRYLEFGLSIILSKLVVALAFATGAAMIGGLGSSPTFAQAVGALLEALAILFIACFAPFILIRLIIGAETIIAAEGLERRPLRVAMAGAQASYYARGLSSTFKKMGGGAMGGDGASGPSPTDGTPTPGGGSPSRGGPGGSGTSAGSSRAMATEQSEYPKSTGDEKRPNTKPSTESDHTVPPSSSPGPSTTDATTIDNTATSSSVPHGPSGGEGGHPGGAKPGGGIDAAQTHVTPIGEATRSVPPPADGHARESSPSPLDEPPTPPLIAPDAPPPPRRMEVGPGLGSATGPSTPSVPPTVSRPTNSTSQAKVRPDPAPAPNAPMTTPLGRSPTTGRSHD